MVLRRSDQMQQEKNLPEIQPNKDMIIMHNCIFLKYLVRPLYNYLYYKFYQHYHVRISTPRCEWCRSRKFPSFKGLSTVRYYRVIRPFGWTRFCVALSESFLLSLAAPAAGCSLPHRGLLFIFHIDLSFLACTTAYICSHRQHFNCTSIIVDYHFVLCNRTHLTPCVAFIHIGILSKL